MLSLESNETRIESGYSTALQANGNEGNKVLLSMRPEPLILSDMRSGRHAAALLPAGTRDSRTAGPLNLGNPPALEDWF